MNSVFSGLMGNESIKNALSGSLSHAYIIEGQAGSGRLTSARNAAAAVLCERRDVAESPLPCYECSVCSRIFRGIHPDVTEYSSEGKKSIGVGVIRNLRDQVFIAPSESEYRFFIIRDADLMTVEAQNALLISLEEPPPFSVFFLLVTDRSALLETIRSRCTALTTEKLSEGVIKDALSGNPEYEKLLKNDPAALENIIRSADGSLGKAISLITEGSGEEAELRRLTTEFIRVILTGSPSDKVRLTTVFPKTRDTQEKVFTLGLSAVRDIISQRLHACEQMLFYTDPSDASAFSFVSLERLLSLFSALDAGRIALTENLSPSLTAERIIMQKI